MVEKIALVTGANRGLGLEIAHQLSQQGIIVYIAARKLEEAQRASSQIPHAKAIQLDVTNQADIDQAVKTIANDYGRLDILVNNAGVNLEADRNTTGQSLRDVYEINTIAPYLITQAFVPLLEKSASGRVVNQSSILGSISSVSEIEDEEWLFAGYSSSKAALNMLTVIQATKLKNTNIKVNACHPGWVKTRMGGEDAELEVSDGAKTAVRLALLPENGPSGKFFHDKEELPW